MSSPAEEGRRVALPPGHRMRPPAPADAEAVARMVSAAELDAGSPEAVEAADMLDTWRELDPERDAWLVEGPAGEIAGYADLTSVGIGLALDPYVAPDAHGRGLAAALVAEGERRAAPREPILRCPVLASDRRWRSLLDGLGFHVERYFLRMAMALPAPERPRWSRGVDVCGLSGELDEQAHDVFEAAFAGSWGHRAEPLDAWRERFLTGAGCDRTLSLVAVEDGRVAGVALNARRFGGGYVERLAVRPDRRRRGLGLALLLQSAVELERRGERRLALGVDAANSTGARRLYERAGMHVEWEAAVYEKRLRD
jgi:mycothiol synthase